MRITATGSLPGADFRGALSAMTEALPEVLPLPELPERDGSLITRAVGLIDTLGFDLQPAGWRLTAHRSTQQRRIAARLRRDLDDVEELLEEFDGVLKVAIAGPWTLAAQLERPRGDKLLADYGARREVAQALVEAANTLRSEVSRRVPGATVWLQLDEPCLGQVRAGQVPTASGFSRHRSVAEAELVAAWQPLAAGALLHNCGPGRWFDLAQRAGFSGVLADARLSQLDDLAEWLEADRLLVLGVVDTSHGVLAPVDDIVRTALRVLRAVQVNPGDNVMLGTACGLASYPAGQVLDQLSALRRASGLVTEALEAG